MRRKNYKLSDLEPPVKWIKAREYNWQTSGEKF
jgi:hypothetical protein